MKRGEGGLVGWSTATVSRRLVHLLLVVASLAIGLACSTAEQKHRVLTFFFDGVPPLGGSAAQPDAGVNEAADDASKLSMRRPAPKPFTVHKPFAEKQCNRCHETAVSNRLKMAREELCWDCHLSEDFSGPFVHGPAGAGLCAACHSPHRSPNEHLLLKPGSKICDRCHNEETFLAIDQHRQERGDNCLQCHDPHAADRAYLVRDETTAPEESGPESRLPSP